LRDIANPLMFEGRAVRDLLPKKAAKKDCLQREQLKAWFAAVRSLDNPTASAYLQILLLTGARREELAQLKWRSVAEAGIEFIPRQEQTPALSSAVAIAA
jgi:integrase